MQHQSARQRGQTVDKQVDDSDQAEVWCGESKGLAEPVQQAAEEDGVPQQHADGYDPKQVEREQRQSPEQRVAAIVDVPHLVGEGGQHLALAGFPHKIVGKADTPDQGQVEGKGVAVARVPRRVVDIGTVHVLAAGGEHARCTVTQPAGRQGLKVVRAQEERQAGKRQQRGRSCRHRQQRQTVGWVATHHLRLEQAHGHDKHVESHAYGEEVLEHLARLRVEPGCGRGGEQLIATVDHKGQIGLKEALQEPAREV